MSKKTDVVLVEKLLQTFVHKNGRRPRMLLLSTEIYEQQDVLHRIAIQLSDLGFDVDFAPTFIDVNHIVKQAIENDVHSIHLVVSGDERIDTIKDIESALIQNDCYNILVSTIEIKDPNNSIATKAVRLLKALLKQSN
jgi:methylmalonyl-CoA mutase cobalamin-binding domain/chain